MPTLATATRNAVLDAIDDLINTGSGTANLRGYTTGGSASGTLLFECAFGNPAFAGAASGSMAANAITADSSANATGTLAVAEIFNRNNASVFTGITCGTSGAEINFNTLSITTGDNVSISSLTITCPAS